MAGSGEAARDGTAGPVAGTDHECNARLGGACHDVILSWLGRRHRGGIVRPARRGSLIGWMKPDHASAPSSPGLLAKLHGQHLRAGDRVLLLLGAANRDERVFDDPDRYDLARNTKEMVSFGQGTHFCLGAALARLEARVALEEVRTRLPDYEIDPTGIVRIHSSNVRGFAALPIGF